MTRIEIRFILREPLTLRDLIALLRVRAPWLMADSPLDGVAVEVEG